MCTYSISNRPTDQKKSSDVTEPVYFSHPQYPTIRVFSEVHTLKFYFLNFHFHIILLFISGFPKIVSFLQVLQSKCCMHFLVFLVRYIFTLNNLLDIITVTIISFISCASNYHDGACVGLSGPSTSSIALYIISTISHKFKSDNHQKSPIVRQ